MHLFNGNDDRALGHYRLFIGLWRRQCLLGQSGIPIHEQRFPILGCESWCLGDPDEWRHSGTDGHAIPRHVFHHHSSPDLRRLRGENEIQRDGPFLGDLGLVGLLPHMSLGLGRRHPCPRRRVGRWRVGFCRGHRGAHQQWHLSTPDRNHDWPTRRSWFSTDAAP